MLRPRVIPCLLMSDRGLYKTIQFKIDKYIGDPINAVRIFNEKKADELMLLDIGAGAKSSDIDYEIIGSIASQCRMPFCYGGGVRNINQVKNLIKLGVEKVAISAAALKNFDFIQGCVHDVGSQSIAIVLDVKKNLKTNVYEIYVNNGRELIHQSMENVISRLNEIGVGELVINSIDNDGMMQGYDLILAKLVWSLTDIPVTFLGGCGSIDDISSLIKEFGLVGIGAGSFFIYKGAYRAVLISYPERKTLDDYIEKAFQNFGFNSTEIV